MSLFQTVNANGQVVVWPSRKKCKQVAPRLERENRFRRRALLQKIRGESAALNRKLRRANLDDEARSHSPQAVPKANLWQRVKGWFRGRHDG